MKYCPIVTGRGKYFNTVRCYEGECAWWDEQRKQCLAKSLMQALLGDASTPLEQWQAEYAKQMPKPKSTLGELADYLKTEDLW